VTEELKKGDALLDLLSTDMEQLVGDMKTAGRLGCSDCELVQFRIWTQRTKSKQQDSNLGLWPVQGSAWKIGIPLGREEGSRTAS